MAGVKPAPVEAALTSLGYTLVDRHGDTQVWQRARNPGDLLVVHDTRWGWTVDRLLPDAWPVTLVDRQDGPDAAETLRKALPPTT